MKFSDIIGQEAIKGHFQRSLLKKTTSHAYLLSGEKGSGKRMLAEAFAAALQCEHGGDDACGICKSCRQAQHYNQPDIRYITRGEKASISVKSIRREVCDDVLIRPYAGPYKVYIIEEAERMTEEAQNALLKTLEEPPAYAVLLLLTENADRLLPTVRSRCVQFTISPLSDERIRDYLIREQGHAPEDAARYAAFSLGNPGRALSLTQDAQFREMREDAVQVLFGLGTDPHFRLEEGVAAAEKYKDATDKFLELVELWFRDVVLWKAIGNGDAVVYRGEEKKIRTQAAAASWRGLNRVLEAIGTTKRYLQTNMNRAFSMELLMLSIKELSA